MKQCDQLIRSIEIKEVIVGLRQDGIVHVYYKDGTEINIELQGKLMEILLDITGGINRAIIYEPGEDCSVTKEARENAIAIEHLSPTKCSVVYVHNLAYKIIAEFYYKFNKPKKPYKVVSDFDAGIAWLLKTEKEMTVVT